MDVTILSPAEPTGLMARFALLSCLTEADNLQAFDSEGYAFVPEVSGGETSVFWCRPD